MKRPVIFAVAALMAAASVCAMAGCGSKTETAKNSSAAASAVATTAAAGGEASQAAAGGSVTEADGIATIKGVAVELNGDAAAVVDQLGEYTLTSQTTCHGTEGDDKTYTYDGFVINTYPLDGQDRVLEIVLKSADIPKSKSYNPDRTRAEFKKMKLSPNTMKEKFDRPGLKDLGKLLEEKHKEEGTVQPEIISDKKPRKKSRRSRGKKPATPQPSVATPQPTPPHNPSNNNALSTPSHDTNGDGVITSADGFVRMDRNHPSGSLSIRH